MKITRSREEHNRVKKGEIHIHYGMFYKNEKQGVFIQGFQLVQDGEAIAIADFRHNKLVRAITPDSVGMIGEVFLSEAQKLNEQDFLEFKRK